MKVPKNLCFLLLFIFLSHNSYSQQPKPKAFPSAEGFGKYAIGGRGGAVIKVTNLNDSGPGSLRQALQYTKGPRTIIFEVGGTITLKSVLPIINGEVTIAGQTAPGGGILIKDGHLLVQSSNVIIRHLRFRYGTKPSKYDDSLSITAWGDDIVENIIIDHCSISWGRDENLNIRVPTDGTCRNITVQNTIISESNYGVLLYGPRAYNISFYENLFAHNSERNIRNVFPSDGKFNFEMINNIIYGARASTNPSMGSKFAVINNVYRQSNDFLGRRTAVVGLPSQDTAPESATDAYIEGNLLLNGYATNSSNLIPYMKVIPFGSSGITPRPANQIEDILLLVGASLPQRDAVDSRILQQYKNGNGTLKSSGTYPTIQGGNAQIDTDNDGMPDEWENANGLNPNNANDGNFIQPDGYTNLEYYLNGMSLKTTSITASAGTDVDICSGSSTTLTATGGSSYLWSNGAKTPSITVSPAQTTTYTVTAFDSTGKSSDTDEVKVTVNALPSVDAGSNVTINSGESTTLRATGASTYKWSTGATSASIIVSPTTTMTYSVIGTSNGCDVTDTVTVTVSNTNKVRVDADNDQTICSGRTTTLTATGGSSYLWNTGSKTPSITVSPTQTTTYTVTAFDSTGKNSATAEVKVTVNPLPTVSAGNNITITSGESTILTATGASTYRWSTSASGASITVSPTSTTTYTVTGTGNGCEATSTVTVTVAQPVRVNADAGKDQTICSGTSTTLTSKGGSSYLWSNGSKSASITVSPNQTTTYTVTAYDSTGKNYDTAEVKVTVNPLPTVSAGNNITINSGESTTLTANGASTYKWSTGATSANIIVSPTSTTTYTVTGTRNGCEAVSMVRVTVAKPVRVKANAGNDQSICSGTNATLTATGGSTYHWSTGEKTAVISVSPNKTTTYTVIAYDSTGKNSDSDEVEVTVNTPPTVNAGGNVTINSGEITTITATGASTYNWNTGAKSASITVSPTVTTTYTVTGTRNGCEATSTVRVTVAQPVGVAADAGNDQNICSGTSATLTATGGSTYLWSNGEKTASINISPNQTTTYKVTVFDSSGKNSDTDEVKVTVNSLPIVDAGSNVTINSGENTILTATGAATYKWSTGATSTSITVSPSTTRTYTVTGTRNGCEVTATVKVTVRNPLKVVANAGSNQDICHGSSVTLTATGGDTYLWNTGAKTASITVSPNSTVKYSVIAYVGNASDAAEVVVNVNSNPNVKITNGSEADILAGEFITLSATGAKTYKWNNGATKPNIAVRPNVTQSYYVKGHVDKCASEKSIKVNVFEKVVAYAGDDVTIYRDETTVLTATGPKNSEYLWSTGETTKNITVSPKEDTGYSVMVYHALDSDTANVNVKVINSIDSTILEDSDGIEFLIHPNPTDGELNIRISGLTNLSSIHLYDISGKSLYSEIINESAQQKFIKKLSLSDYASGIYLLQLVDNQRVITKKVVLR